MSEDETPAADDGLPHHPPCTARISGHLVEPEPPQPKLRDVPLPGMGSHSLAAHITARPPIDVTLPWQTPDSQDRARDAIGAAFTTDAEAGGDDGEAPAAA
ncbi:hypothetical protein RM550_26475 [Streptomyces sp. DSM 41527]|uniref:Uncharacterized protein n=1 Tax=Streptomyces mooreae TaxID=3075523 RepID=A0ABU2TE49_9ACTN|nr:hypothetical protein [Streptomyces sp. DSM 41527]MDT0459221.1 hypothetical protein [Streptomyces sp. DSM 41527]